MNDQTCRECQHFRQHYTLCDGKLYRVFCGHCTFGKVRTKQPYSTLEAMSRVLRLTEQETDDLFLAAYPKFRVWRIANQRNLDFDNTEDLLDEHGCPTLSRVQPYEGD